MHLWCLIFSRKVTNCKINLKKLLVLHCVSNGWMFYVYYLQSLSHSNRTYIGYTSNLKQRIADHNAGKSVYTKDFKPWRIIGFLCFDSELKAIRFEKHLKSHAGRIFLKPYFNDNNEYID